MITIYFIEMYKCIYVSNINAYQICQYFSRENITPSTPCAMRDTAIRSLILLCFEAVYDYVCMVNLRALLYSIVLYSIVLYSIVV